jgi:hypothetical protein
MALAGCLLGKTSFVLSGHLPEQGGARVSSQMRLPIAHVIDNLIARNLNLLEH